MMFLQISKSCPSPIQRSDAIAIINPSYKLRSLLFANELLVKINSFTSLS
jgi:hypothetical protein